MTKNWTGGQTCRSQHLVTLVHLSMLVFRAQDYLAWTSRQPSVLAVRTVRTRLIRDKSVVPMWHGAPRNDTYSRRCYTWENTGYLIFCVRNHPIKHFYVQQTGCMKGLTSQAIHNYMWYGIVLSLSKNLPDGVSFLQRLLAKNTFLTYGITSRSTDAWTSSSCPHRMTIAISIANKVNALH